MASSSSKGFPAASLPSYGVWTTKKPFICTLFRRMLGMATCSESSRTLFLYIKSELEAALGPLVVKQLERGDNGARKTPVCPCCQCLMMRPVCLPCGHSLCKPCLARSPSRFSGDSARCPRCQQSWPVVAPGMSEERRPTLALQNVFMRWYPGWAECCKYREEGNRFAQEGDFPLAVHWYNKALETGVPDHRVLSNRSRAYLAMERLIEALADAELCCKLKPTWPKGHFRRGAVLEKLGDWVQSVAAFYLCLYFSGTNEMTKVICQIFDQHLQSVSDRKSSVAPAQELGKHVVAICLARVAQCDMAAATDMREAREGEGEGERDVPQSLVNQADFECVLCTGLLYNPVTAACGHSFCQDCLSRSFDHTPFCPICRSPLSESFVQYARMSGKMNIDSLLEGVLTWNFREFYEEKRVQLVAESLRQSRVGLSDSQSVPVFVCTMAFPSLPSPLHVFEPRYRLMIRRCMETGSRRFGMCQYTEAAGFSSYGTVLYINTVEHTPDGRSLITTTGEKRFRVLERGVCDGYSTAKIEFIVDEPVTDFDEIVSLKALQQEVFDHAQQWLEALPVYARLLLTQTVCCPLPGIEAHPECCPNGPMWLWWYVKALPTSTERKADFLKSTSLKQRLLKLKDSLPLPSTTFTT